ncbi:MAG: ferritin-like domain-containing protein [Gemmataceae bacterium]|nr:ferritin-like domain-containing protein [Gemmataceae bacterium]
MDTGKLIDKLNEILRWEWTGVVQYTQHSFLVQDLWREVYAPMFAKGAEESLGHARKIGEKIVAMGGVPTVERSEVRQSTGLEEMLQYDLEFEREAVRLYGQAIELCPDSHPTRILLEDIILDEQEGVEHLEKLLRTRHGTAAGKQGGAASRVG